MGTCAPVGTAVQACVLLNVRAGTAARRGLDPESLRSKFAAAGLTVDVQAMPDEGALAAQVRRAVLAGVPIVVAAGGDGTVGTVAAALVGTRTALGILPAGTRNHFARDLGLPSDLDAAIPAIANGRPRVVDVGEVNGRIFVNNASIGLYPAMVEEREMRQRVGWTKPLATVWSSLIALRRFRPMRVRLAAEGDVGQRTTPFVFVGNNEYDMSLFSLGRRKGLDAGTLSLYTAKVRRRFGLVRLAFMALIGRLDQARDFEQRCVTELWLDSRWRRLRVALDGEVVTLAPPLHFRVRPGALRVIVADVP
jgi:diacylglycerol kinase family enzyme